MAREQTRRRFLQTVLGATAGFAAAPLAAQAAGLATSEFATPAPGELAASGLDTQISAADALQRLIAGNLRYRTGRFLHPNAGPARRAQEATGQMPFAIVLSCSDSRVPPEVVFDRGIGDLFVARVAGNSINDELLGSIEYAAEHFNSPLLVVLGHERCGAVIAAVDTVLKGTRFPGHIQSLADPIVPAVNQVRAQPGDIVDNSVRAHIRRSVAALKASEPILAERVRANKLRVVGARYDLETGQAEFIA